MPPNSTGVIPAYLTNESAQLGRAVKASFSPESALARKADLTAACGGDAAFVELASGALAFDAVVLEEDIAKGNQRVAGYELQICTAAGAAGAGSHGCGGAEGRIYRVGPKFAS